MKTHDAADILAEIVAALLAGHTPPAGHCPVHYDLVARPKSCDALADRGYFPGSLGAHHKRQLPLGEGHAAKAPQVKMIERHRLDSNLHVALAWQGRWRYVGKFKLAVGDQSQRTHGKMARAALRPARAP